MLNHVALEQHRAHVARRARIDGHMASRPLLPIVPRRLVVIEELEPPPVRKELREERSEQQQAEEALASCGPTIRRIVTATAAHFDVEPWQILVRRRVKQIAHRRFVAMILARQRCRLSFPQIGRRFGGFNHSTIIHAVNRAAIYAEDVAAVEAILDACDDVSRETVAEAP